MTNKRRFGVTLAAVAALAMYALTTSVVLAAHGGGHGGGHAGSGHHGGGAHRQPHPYHPSKHHEAHHAQHHDEHHGDHHQHFAHHNHHHESWHRGGWGPGFWGGAAAGYGLGYAGWGGWGYNGGDTYVDNSTTVNPVSNESGDDDSSSNDDSSDDSADNSPETITNQYAAASPNSTNNFPVDDWPELGVATYSGQYGASQGQVVVRVVPNSAAAKAGVVPGDVILSLNGQPTPSADSLDTILDAANGRFEAEVWDARTGRTSTISGQLDRNAPATEGPESRDTAAAGPQSR